jgi:hypothetical protein
MCYKAGQEITVTLTVQESTGIVLTLLRWDIVVQISGPSDKTMRACNPNPNLFYHEKRNISSSRDQNSIGT